MLVVVVLGVAGGRAPAAPAPEVRLDRPFVVTQIPAGTDLEKRPPLAAGTLRVPYGEGGRLLLVAPDGTTRVLSEGFHSACDPEVSFDAARLLFAGKRAAADAWNVFEMQADGTGVRQVTRDHGDCRQPAYQATLYTLDSPQPWYQVTFVSNAAGTMDEYGAAVATHLYSCKLDGSALRRLTFTISGDVDPFLMADGRLLLASWQRFGLDRGLAGRVALFGVGIDGTDYAVLAADEGRRVKHMPCTTTRGLAVFVESDAVGWDGAGRLACVALRRPLHSYRPITDDGDGLFHTPSPLPDGQILVSRRPSDGSGTHGVWRLDPATGRRELVFDDPAWHDIQARLIHPRPEADGRSTVVAEKDPHGKLYCLNVYLSDVEPSGGMPPGSVKRLRVLEGVPAKAGQAGAYLPAGGKYPAGATVRGIPPLVQRRILGEIDVEEDGSFNVEVPADTPIQLQVLDADGMALRSSAWIWAKNHEPRGCIGCHEDGELTPENTFVQAMTRPSVVLALPAERRRTVDFRRDVLPIVSGKCVSCHRAGGPPPHLDGGPAPAGGAGAKAPFSRAYEA
ncbi:MAG: hypothetical protein IMZ66_00335, partial [Planctomycetes bacterium]|nr:hypothetical protein [Planctomycetota bacterium]